MEISAFIPGKEGGKEGVALCLEVNLKRDIGGTVGKGCAVLSEVKSPKETCQGTSSTMRVAGQGHKGRQGASGLGYGGKVLYWKRKRMIEKKINSFF